MEAIREIVMRHLQNVQKGIVVNMQKMHRTTSGRSVASLLIEDEGTDGMAHLLLTGDKQWEVMERGRGPGNVPHNFADIIKEWILRKGISYQQFAPKKGPTERGLTNLSWMIAQSIMKKGTKLHRDNGYNDIFDTLLKEETEKLAIEAQGIIATEVDTINDKDDAEKSNS
jgi:hypothetical protein